MPLILGLQKGHDFFVGADMTQVVVSDIEDGQHFTLTVNGQDFKISDECSQEILPDVRISCGNRSNSELARLIIDAPREIGIYRGNVAFLKRKNRHADVPVFHRSSKPSPRADANGNLKRLAPDGTLFCAGNSC